MRSAVRLRLHQSGRRPHRSRPRATALNDQSAERRLDASTGDENFARSCRSATSRVRHADVKAGRSGMAPSRRDLMMKIEPEQSAPKGMRPVIESGI